MSLWAKWRSNPRDLFGVQHCLPCWRHPCSRLSIMVVSIHFASVSVTFWNWPLKKSLHNKGDPAVSPSLLHTLIYIASKKFTQHEEVTSMEILVNWSKVMHSPLSRHLKATTIKSRGNGDCSSHMQARYLESISRNTFAQISNLPAQSSFTTTSSVFAFFAYQWSLTLVSLSPVS